METLLKGRSDRSSFQNNCRLFIPVHSAASTRLSRCVSYWSSPRGGTVRQPPPRAPLSPIRCSYDAGDLRCNGRFLSGIQRWQFDLSRIPFRVLVHGGALRTACFDWTKRHGGVLKRDLESYFNRTKLILDLGGLSEREVLHCKRFVLGITNSNAPGTELTLVNWNDNSTASLIMSELSPV